MRWLGVFVFCAACGLISYVLWDRYVITRAQVISPTSPDQLEIRMSGRAAYHTPGTVNGIKVKFLVDTGATNVSLPAELAQQAGIRCELDGKSKTANGITSACSGTADKLSFGPFLLTNISVSILPNLDEPLLGMNALRRFKMSFSDNKMRISLDKEKAEEAAQEKVLR